MVRNVRRLQVRIVKAMQCGNPNSDAVLLRPRREGVRDA